jgi:hypothetical protein
VDLHHQVIYHARRTKAGGRSEKRPPMRFQMMRMAEETGVDTRLFCKKAYLCTYFDYTN